MPAGLALLVVALGARFGGAALAAIDQLPVGDTRDAGEAAMHAFDLMGWSLVAAGLFMLLRDRSWSGIRGEPASRPIGGGPPSLIMYGKPRHATPRIAGRR